MTQNKLYSWEYDWFAAELHTALADKKKQFWSVHTVKEIVAMKETHCPESRWPYFITISGKKLLDGIKCSKKFPLFCFGLFFCGGCQTVSDAKLCRVQSGVCACGLFSSLSGLDWGTQLTRGCTHRPPDGGVDPGGGRRVGGQRGLLLVRDASQKQSADALLCRSWLWIKKTAPLPRSILLSWDGGIRLGLFSSYLSGSKAIQQMVNIWSVEENMKIHLERIKTNGVTG